MHDKPCMHSLGCYNLIVGAYCEKRAWLFCATVHIFHNFELLFYRRQLKGDIFYLLFHWRQLTPNCQHLSATQTLYSQAPPPARRSSREQTQIWLCEALLRKLCGGRRHWLWLTIWAMMLNSHDFLTDLIFCLGGSRCDHMTRLYMCRSSTNPIWKAHIKLVCNMELNKPDLGLWSDVALRLRTRPGSNSWPK